MHAFFTHIILGDGVSEGNSMNDEVGGDLTGRRFIDTIYEVKSYKRST